MSTTLTPRTSTPSLLTGGMLAGPFYLVVFAAQALTREGFDITRHAGSLLTNGQAGWIQTVNFAVTGLLIIVASAGMRRTAAIGKWAPWLLGVFGASFVVAGIFTPDPAFGFPPGAPDVQGSISWHGLVHFAAGGIGFPCFVACCLIVARRFARDRRPGWAWFSAVTGVLFLAAFAGISSGSGGAGVTLPFLGAVILAFAWIAALSAHLRKDAR